MALTRSRPLASQASAAAPKKRQAAQAVLVPTAGAEKWVEFDAQVSVASRLYAEMGVLTARRQADVEEVAAEVDARDERNGAWSTELAERERALQEAERDLRQRRAQLEAAEAALVEREALAAGGGAATQAPEAGAVKGADGAEEEGGAVGAAVAGKFPGA